MPVNRVGAQLGEAHAAALLVYQYTRTAGMIRLSQPSRVVRPHHSAQ